MSNGWQRVTFAHTMALVEDDIKAMHEVEISDIEWID